MEAAVAATLLLLALVGVLLLIGRYYPGSGAEQLDWKPARSHEDEIALELEDIDQMLEAQNERRRRTGRTEITEDQIRSEIHAEERAQEERRDSLRQDRDEGES